MVGSSAILAQQLADYGTKPAVEALQQRLAALQHHPDLDALCDLYHEAVPIIEGAMWHLGFEPSRLAALQRLYREMEQHLTLQGHRERHHFVIVIPVADRPQHLHSCLESLLQLCQLYGYGGMQEGRYAKVEVVIADDSRSTDSIRQHQQIAVSFQQRGLATFYLGQQQQWALLQQLSAEQRQMMRTIIGDQTRDTLSHKGASMMRNIAYLYLHSITGSNRRQLFYFIDSDQEFQVTLNTEAGESTAYAINYLYHLDRIFQEQDRLFLTGKVVGDPPVSPSVMAANLLDDLNRFIAQLALTSPDETCLFHQQTQQPHDAAYHDMADLFGFKGPDQPFDYRCTINGEHNHRACLAGFAHQLGRFFDGEHPTRRSYYQYQPLNQTLQPARTIYTGNYIFRPEGLGWFIPFAPLRLRMAGPLLGRLIQAAQGSRFASVNLPMLHKRTVASIGQSEFRPGIQRQVDSQRVDLSAEFERQFFGDVMLFTIAALTQQGFPQQPLSDDLIIQTQQQMEAELLGKYRIKHQLVVNRLQQLKALWHHPDQWWHQQPGYEDITRQVESFLDNMDHNFGDQAAGVALIESAPHRDQRRQQCAAAIQSYPTDQKCWSEWMACATSTTYDTV